MTEIQNILVYITLAIAVIYLIRKYLWPKRILSSKKSNKPCGHDECGCK